MSVTAAKGFRAAGVATGPTSTARDVALVVNDGPQDAAAAVLTTDRADAGAVTWSRQVVADGRVRAVVLDSGGANAGTGPDGFLGTHRTAEHVAEVLAISAADVVVCSAGPVGDRLPVPALLAGVDAAAQALSTAGGDDAAEAIRTTGSRATQAHVAGDGFVVGGMATGVPGPATTGSVITTVITTDAVAGAADLHDALAAARTTSDRVDADVSADDTVLLLASGASGVTPTADDLARAVHDVYADLGVPADVEGRADVEGCADVEGRAS